MADLLMRADSLEGRDAIIDQLVSIMNCTGGWVGRYDEQDELDDLEVRLIVPRASEEELKAIWERVQAGESAEAAHRAVNGPSYHHQRRRRAESARKHPEAPEA